MNTSPEPALLHLRKDEVRRLRGDHWRCIAVFEGEVWVTLTGDHRDFILAAGESLDLEADADAVVQALVPSALLPLFASADDDEKEASRGLDGAALPAIWAGAKGHPVLLRAIRANDDRRFGDFVRELSPASRYNRFHSAVRELPEPWLGALMHVDPARELALLALSVEGGRAVCIAEARYALHPDFAGAREFALVVADHWQGQGLGGDLLQRLVSHARERGVERLFGEVLSTNAKMIRLATRAGFRIAAHPDDRRLVRVTRSLGQDRANQAATSDTAPAGRAERVDERADVAVARLG